MLGHAPNAGAAASSRRYRAFHQQFRWFQLVDVGFRLDPIGVLNRLARCPTAFDVALPCTSFRQAPLEGGKSWPSNVPA
jgi:hypothetical protein